jgi:hypothetical protein
MGLALRRALDFPPCGAAAAQAPAAQRSGIADRGRRPNANGAEAGAYDRALNRNDPAEHVCLVQQFLQWEMTRSG